MCSCEYAYLSARIPLVQISQHNHKINDEIYTCYTNNSSVPDDLLLGPSEELDEQSSPSRMMRSFEPEDAEFENSSRMLAELDGHVDVDHGTKQKGMVCS